MGYIMFQQYPYEACRAYITTSSQLNQIAGASVYLKYFDKSVEIHQNILVTIQKTEFVTDQEISSYV